ncbi:MAG: GNAT family N-acetyltransferase [Rhodobacteraceae bacterium]|nr:GNAT family N-acetyltransferase [Paracoccaceae bacterium]
MIAPLPPEALVLQTDRLRLRPWTMQDSDFAHEILTDARVMKYVKGEPMTTDAVAAHLSDAERRGAGGRIGIWCAEIRATGERIGDGVLTPIPIEGDDVDWSQVVPDRYPTDQIEVGYLLKPAAWGQGYATEICKRLLRFGFEMTELSQIVACTDPDNLASQHVLRKSGLRDCGTARAYSETVAWFEITRAEWAAQAAQAPHQLPSGSPG